MVQGLPHDRRAAGCYARKLELETVVPGVLDRQQFLDLLQRFMVFEEDPDSGALRKIIAGYHQFHAVNAAVRASGMTGSSVLREDAGSGYAAGHRGHAGEARNRFLDPVWIRLVEMNHRHIGSKVGSDSRGAGACPTAK